jgi:adenylate cyclase
VQGAIGIQSSMTKREAEQREDQRIRYRVGINLGDVIHDDGDIFGDGVNVAAQSGAGRALLRQCFEVGRGGA